MISDRNVLDAALAELTDEQLVLAEIIMERLERATPEAIKACEIDWSKVDWSDIDWVALVDTPPKL